jgi:hypothetical protein
VKVGNKIQVAIKPPKSNGMTFKPKVLTYEIKEELKWLGHLLFEELPFLSEKEC